MRFLLVLIVFTFAFASFSVRAQEEDSSFDITNPDFNFGNPENEEQDSVDEEQKAPLNPYDKKYRPMAMQLEQSGLLPDFIVQPSFIRLPGVGADELNLRVVTPGSVSGCLKGTGGVVEPTFYGNSLNVKLTPAVIEAASDTARYAHYTCDIKTSTAQIDLKLSRQELLDKHIDKIIFTNPDVGPFSQLQLTMSDTRVSFLTKRPLGGSFKAYNGMPLSQDFWIYPENTLVLTAPGANMDEENLVRIRTMAREKGLMPLEEILQDFTPSDRNAAKVYVVDQKGLYSQAANAESPTPLGEIEFGETFYGPEGAYQKPVRKPVYARAPGLYE